LTLAIFYEQRYEALTDRLRRAGFIPDKCAQRSRFYMNLQLAICSM
jgi:hypothetical protein